MAKRVVRRATVVRTEKLTPNMVRVILSGPDVADFEMPYTDHYIKILFPPPGAGYAWPADPAEIQASYPREQWPVMRTYTIRWRTGETMAIDFVVHGDVGLGGPWAASAQAGETMVFYGPGGAWTPDLNARRLVFVADESALPAVAAALDKLADDTVALAFCEIAEGGGGYPLRLLPKLDLRWVPRADAQPGQALAAAVRAGATFAPGDRWFVHGAADMVGDIRRFLFAEQGVDRSLVSISGYWRTGLTEDDWQAGKHELLARWEAAEGSARVS